MMTMVCVCIIAMLDMLAGYSQQSETVLEVSLVPALNYEQVTRLFDIIPGLDTCHYDHTTGISVCLSVCLFVSLSVCLSDFDIIQCHIISSRVSVMW